MAPDLQILRQEIDRIDDELLRLLNRRAAISIDVGKSKAANTQIFNPRREENILNELREKNSGPLPDAHMAAIWREIFSSSRTLQRRQRAAYLGPEGTFSHAAGLACLGHSVDMMPCPDLRDVFMSVHNRDCDLGVIPLENSLHGTVVQSVDLFMETEVRILAETYLRISHSLLSLETSRENVCKVYSHPQALAQCEMWLRAKMPGAELVAVESTAKSALLAANERGAAAIASAELADDNNLHVLAANIADTPDNYTRFLVIGPHNESEAIANNALPVDKTSILFTVSDKPGALAKILNLLARENINISKLESRPQKGHKWRYIFFADIDCELDTPAHRHIIHDLKELCDSLRILGSYVRARQPLTPAPGIFYE